MTRPTPLALALLTPLVLGACQSTQQDAPPIAASDAEVAKPTAFIEAACGGCHGIEPPFLSPNPAAPSFESIANRAGLDEDTLGMWLGDAHNYPEMMDFDLGPDRVEEVANYMITLKRDDYKPES